MPDCRQLLSSFRLPAPDAARSLPEFAAPETCLQRFFPQLHRQRRNHMPLTMTIGRIFHVCHNT
jgi:hypothetical protein